jgi:CRP-like cAMP-binding protein
MTPHHFSPIRDPDRRPKNRLLAAIPPSEYRRLLPDLATVVVKPKQQIYKMGAPVTDVYFPNGGVYSMITGLSDGSMVESVTIGNEGMLGIEAFVRPQPTAYGHTILQVPDTITRAERLSAAALRRELAHRGVLADLLGRYLDNVVTQMMQSLACNALHSVQERCCRWLLMTHDRVEGDEFVLSQEFLAMMLGTRRQTVTVVAGALQAAGLIRYRYGRILVQDREGLEAGACECYSVVRRQLDQLFLTGSSATGQSHSVSPR